MAKYLAVRETGKYGFPKTKKIDNRDDLVTQQDVNNNDVPTLTRPSMFPDKTETTDDPVDGDGEPILLAPQMKFDGQATPASTPSDNEIPILDIPEMDFSK